MAPQRDECEFSLRLVRYCRRRFAARLAIGRALAAACPACTQELKQGLVLYEDTRQKMSKQVYKTKLPKSGRKFKAFCSAFSRVLAYVLKHNRGSECRASFMITLAGVWLFARNEM